LERSLSGDDTLGSEFFEKGMQVKRSVGRIRLRLGQNQTAYGTGFLVAPGVLMTNHHVIEHPDWVGRCEVDFGYEIDTAGREKTPFVFRLDPGTFLSSKEFDFTLVGVSPNTIRGEKMLDRFGYLPLNPQPAKVLLKQCMSIIQHPNGKRKRVAIRENRLMKITDHHLWYYTDTERGSSGSPVFNDAWEVVGLHHSGVIRQDDRGNYLKLDGTVWDGVTPIDDAELDWIANEAIRVSTIYDFLRANFATKPGVAEVLNAVNNPPKSEKRSFEQPKSPNSINPMEQPYYIHMPITIVIGNGSSANGPVPAVTVAGGGRPTGQQTDAQPDALITTNPSGSFVKSIEAPRTEDVAVERFTGKYDDLIPYQADHLGISVPLPEPKEPTLINDVLTYQENGQRKKWLDYIHFSVLMSKGWKFALITAVNVDGSQEKENIERRKWFFDGRIKREDQFEPASGTGYYGTSTMNRGHMVRRQDPVWGNQALAKRASDYTFHLTNAVPQAATLNQERWSELEDFILHQAWNQDKKISVFTAPILLSTPESMRKRWFGPYRGTIIPMAFWKVVAYLNDQGDLACAAFLMEQVADVSKLELDYANPGNLQIRQSQISLQALTEISGIAFDAALYKGDVMANRQPAAGRGAELGVQPAYRVIKKPEDMLL
jgi:endonuclease G